MHFIRNPSTALAVIALQALRYACFFDFFTYWKKKKMRKSEILIAEEILIRSP